MAKFSFTISGSSIDVLKSQSAGVNADFEVTSDRGMNRTVQHSVLTAKFGDGYEQRVKNGINTKQDRFDVQYANRTASSINLIAAFLDDKAGKSFDFTITELSGDNIMKVVCDQYAVNYGREDFHSLQAQFRRVYEP